MEKNKLKIDSFKGEYNFLSNFYLHDVEFEGEIYKSNEHAYCAAKTLDPDERWLIRSAATPGKAKKLGRSIVLRGDWDQIKFDIMLDLLRKKFVPRTELSEKLLITGDAHLEEGNWWGDFIWGVCRGKGLNMLGKLLMQVRDELNENT